MSSEANREVKDSSFDRPTQDSSYFSDFVTVISGARQTANQEFNRFWEKFGLNKGNNINTTSTQTPTSSRKMIPTRQSQLQNRDQKSVPAATFRNKNDLARMKAGQSIYGRIIPDTNRRGYIKDAEIQTDDLMDEDIRASSSVLVPIQEQLQPVDTKKEAADNKPTYTYKRKSSLVSKDLNDILSRPQKIPKRDSTPPVITTTPSATLKTAFIAHLSKSAKHTADEEELGIADTRVPKVIKQSLSTARRFISSTPVHLSPERHGNKSDIVTGSAKSVKRLTSELEEAFSPRFPPSFTSATKRTFHDSSSSSISNSNSSSSEVSSTNHDPFQSTPIIQNSQSLTSTQNKRLTQEEEDERMEQLEKKVGTIQSQMSNFVSYPSSIKSPKPSHTVTSMINTIQEITPELSTSTFVASPVRNTNSSITTASFSITKTSPYSKSNTGFIHSSPSKIPPPVPPAPPAPAAIMTTFSPIRDKPFNYHASPFRSDVGRDRPITHHIHVSPIVKDEQKKSPTAFRPNDKHKTKMRELIQLIPGVKLRKTDKIMGPDGTEIPNPFWNEIYNPGGRRVL